MKLDRTELYRQFSDLGEFNPASREDAKSRLNSLSESNRLSKLIESILHNESWLSDIARRSYTHDNGFDKLVLIKFDDPEKKLRLHIWDPSLVPQSPSDVNIHNHRWNFCSSVLFGSMKFEIFEKENSGTKFHEYKYTPVSSTNKYSLEERGTENLIRKFSGTLSAGTNYSIEHSVIHRTYVETEQPTATLMIQGPERKPMTSVFSTENIDNTGRTDATTISKKGIKTRLRKILKWV